jgi:hypothetical protein
MYGAADEHRNISPDKYYYSLGHFRCFAVHGRYSDTPRSSLAHKNITPHPFFVFSQFFDGEISIKEQQTYKHTNMKFSIVLFFAPLLASVQVCRGSLWLIALTK